MLRFAACGPRLLAGRWHPRLVSRPPPGAATTGVYGLKFSKYHGAGNDFIHVDGRSEKRDWAALAVPMCERYTGAGADGLIIAEPSSHADFMMRVFNADGTEAEM